VRPTRSPAVLANGFPAAWLTNHIHVVFVGWRVCRCASRALCLPRGIGCTDDLGADVREREIDCGRMLAVDGGFAVGMETPPLPIVGAPQPLVGVVEPCREPGVVCEPQLELCRKPPRSIGDRPTHRACSGSSCPPWRDRSTPRRSLRAGGRGDPRRVPTNARSRRSARPHRPAMVCRPSWSRSPWMRLS
jgi:hypothetical protein